MEEEEEITDSEEEQVILEEVSRKKRRVIRPPKRVVSPPPPWSPRRHLHPPRKEIPLPPPLSTLNSHNTQVLLSRSLYLHVQNAVFSGGRVSLWRGWCTRSCASRGERNNRKTNILRYINRLDTTSTT